MMCEKCGRKLKDAISIERGYGPVCWKQINGVVCSIKKAKMNSEPEIVNLDIPGQMSFEDFPGVIPGEKKWVT